MCNYYLIIFDTKVEFSDSRKQAPLHFIRKVNEVTTFFCICLGVFVKVCIFLCVYIFLLEYLFFLFVLFFFNISVVIIVLLQRSVEVNEHESYKCNCCRLIFCLSFCYSCPS